MDDGTAQVRLRVRTFLVVVADQTRLPDGRVLSFTVRGCFVECPPGLGPSHVVDPWLVRGWSMIGPRMTRASTNRKKHVYGDATGLLNVTKLTRANIIPGVALK